MVGEWGVGESVGGWVELGMVPETLELLIVLLAAGAIAAHNLGQKPDLSLRPFR